MRIVGAAIFTFVLVLAMRERALAVTEYCPAYVSAPQSLAQADQPSSLWSYNVQAFGPRSVRGDIIAETTDGWYTFEFPSVELTLKTIGYSDGLGRGQTSYGEHVFVSPVLYIGFPHPVKIEHWWVSDALTSGDRLFNWDTRGLFSCVPNPATYTPIQQNSEIVGSLDMLATPSPRDVIGQASPTAAPPGAASCAHPFGRAVVDSAAPVIYPQAAQDTGAEGTLMVMVAINARGLLDDAWIVGFSGNWAVEGGALRAMGDEALRVARKTKYAAGTALCQPVPTLYRYLIMFST